MASKTDQKLELLKSIPLLRGLGRGDLETVGRLTEEIDVPAGHVLMREGATGNEFFIIVTGFVRIDRGGTVVKTLGSGDFFGEISLVDEGPRSATATTDTAATLMVLNHREFHSLMDQFPSIRLCVLQSLAARVRHLEPEAVN